MDQQPSKKFTAQNNNIINDEHNEYKEEKRKERLEKGMNIIRMGTNIDIINMNRDREIGDKDIIKKNLDFKKLFSKEKKERIQETLNLINYGKSYLKNLLFENTSFKKIIEKALQLSTNIIEIKTYLLLVLTLLSNEEDNLYQEEIYNFMCYKIFSHVLIVNHNYKKIQEIKEVCEIIIKKCFLLEKELFNNVFYFSQLYTKLNTKEDLYLLLKDLNID